MNIESVPGHSLNIVSLPLHPIYTLPEEIALHILSFLPFGALSHASSVCSFWNRLIQQYSLWKPQEQNLVEDFTSLVKKNVLSWKEVHLYSRLSSFFGCILENKYWPLARQQNPELGRLSLLNMPNFFIKYGNYSFSISSTTDLKIYNLEKREEIILPGEKGKMLTHLVVEGNYIFALRNDGIIVQWNYKTREQVQKIQTAYAKGNHTQLLELKQSNPCAFYRNCLYVKEGKLVIKYGSDDIELLEIIPYANPDKSQLINNSCVASCLPILLQGEKILLLATSKIVMLNFSFPDLIYFSIKLDLDFSYFISHVALNKQIICAIIWSEELHEEKINIISQKTNQHISFSIPSIHILKIEIIDNLLFGLCPKNKIVIIDLNERKIIKTIPFSIEFPSIESSIIQELVMIAKEYRQPLKIFEEEKIAK